MNSNANDLFFTLNKFKGKIKDKISNIKEKEDNTYLSDIRRKIEDNIDKINSDIQKQNNGYKNTEISDEYVDKINTSSSLNGEVLEEKCSESIKKSQLLSKGKVRLLKSVLLEKVFGQDFVIEEVVDVLKVATLNIKINKQKPAGNYLFAGPSGVGKTELAQTLAKSLDAPILIVNMGEYGLEQDVTKLIGTSPGYVGYNEGGILTNFVKNNPSCIILFDEIEKAHPSADKILLSIMDNGTATDNKGNVVLFKDTIVISTTNLGSDIEYLTGYTEDEKFTFKMESLKEGIRPEILNRYDSIFQFAALSKDVYLKVVNKFIYSLVESMMEEHDINLEISPKLKDFIVEKSYDPAMGGRPARRFIEKIIIKKLADFMIEDHSEDLSKMHPKIILDINKRNNVVFKGKSNKVLGELENTLELVNKIESTKFSK